MGVQLFAVLDQACLVLWQIWITKLETLALGNPKRGIFLMLPKTWAWIYSHFISERTPYVILVHQVTKFQLVELLIRMLTFQVPDFVLDELMDAFGLCILWLRTNMNFRSFPLDNGFAEEACHTYCEVLHNRCMAALADPNLADRTSHVPGHQQSRDG